MPVSLARKTASEIRAAENTIASKPALVGFDGFVDTILHVVDTRESASRYTRLAEMGEYARRIAAAAGYSANFEFVPQMVKLGGNGPIMANALLNLGLPVTYIGNLGHPNIHPVFADFARKAKVISIAEPGYTDAVEFVDGKLMCGKHASLSQVNWQRILEHLPEEKLVAAIRKSALFAIVNWTMLPLMNGILNKLKSSVAPKLQGDKRWIFFDLADPAKRTREDLAGVLRIIAGFQKYFRVILGLNFAESRQVGEVLGFGTVEETYGTVTSHASRIRAALGLETVVVHPVSFAAASDASGSTHVVGPFTAKPKITTGAGDHFNAGFCVGRILGLDLAGSLQCGVGTSGFYVRNAKSPSLPQLRKFLASLG